MEQEFIQLGHEQPKRPDFPFPDLIPVGGLLIATRHIVFVRFDPDVEIHLSSGRVLHFADEGEVAYLRHLFLGYAPSFGPPAQPEPAPAGAEAMRTSDEHTAL
jgi:hypothetical protein